MKVIRYEIGYAIGLKHSHEGDPTLAWDVGDGDHTVMTYNDYEVRLGSLDGVAARHFYGSAASDRGHSSRWSWFAGTKALKQV